MMKVIIKEKFNTTFGQIIRVANDRVYKVNGIIYTDDGQYTIKRIIFSSRPDDDGFINLVV
jgi:hypothetical protein